MVNKSESIQDLSKALCSANKGVKNPQKNATNPHFKKNYATLDSVIESYKNSYLENGITVLENPVTKDDLVGVEVTFLHESGQFITHDPFMLPPGKNTAQGYGSSITYARRYALSAVLNIAAEDDDDGNAASEDNKQNRQLSEPQVKRLYAIAKQAGVEPGAVKSVIMKDYNKTNIADLTKQEYDAVCGRLEQKKGA
jgi:cobalamin biosynthesis Mg chelatase CobN